MSDWQKPYEEDEAYNELASLLGTPVEPQMSFPGMSAPSAQQKTFDEENKFNMAEPEYFARRGRRTGYQAGFDEVAPDIETYAAFKPADEAEHRLKVENPNLNGLEFKSNLGGPSAIRIAGGNDIGDNVNDVWLEDPNVEPSFDRLFSGKRVAGLTYRGAKSDDPVNDKISGEIEKVDTDPEYQGKGLATALWDYASMKAEEGEFDQHPVHSADRSILGNQWATYVGGPARERTKGFGKLEY